MNISFTIPGRIRGKGRPRFSTKNGKVHTFTDAKTEATEATVRQFAAEAIRGKRPLQGPVFLAIGIYQAIPKSWSKARRASAFYLTGKPDADNVAKAISDACNGILYADDSQISDLRVMRRYAQDGAERVEIEVVQMVEPEAEWQVRRNLARRAAA